MRLVHVTIGFAAVGALCFLTAFATDNSAFRLAAIGCQISAAALLIVSSRRRVSNDRSPHR